MDSILTDKRLYNIKGTGYNVFELKIIFTYFF